VLLDAGEQQEFAARFGGASTWAKLEQPPIWIYQGNPVVYFYDPLAANAETRTYKPEEVAIASCPAPPHTAAR